MSVDFRVNDPVHVSGDDPDDPAWTITRIVTDDPEHDGPYAILHNPAGDRSWAGLRILRPAPSLADRVDGILAKHGVTR